MNLNSRSQVPIVPLKSIEYGAYGDLSRIYPKQYSIYLRLNITLNPKLPVAMLVVSSLASAVLLATAYLGGSPKLGVPF